MSTTTTRFLSLAEFRACFVEAAKRYADKVEGSVVSVTDAALASAQEAHLPFFGTHLDVATSVQQFAAASDQSKQKILLAAYQRHYPPPVA